LLSFVISVSLIFVFLFSYQACEQTTLPRSSSSPLPSGRRRPPLCTPVPPFVRHFALPLNTDVADLSFATHLRPTPSLSPAAGAHPPSVVVAALRVPSALASVPHCIHVLCHHARPLPPCTHCRRPPSCQPQHCECNPAPQQWHHGQP
jgi:hypothetical protein